jgi:hypothetical protein
MYEKIIEELKNVGVLFSKGLNEYEIKKIEDFYKLHFPKDLKEFYKEALPVSKGFYDWRNFSEENTEKIKERLSRPQQEIMDDIEEMEWLEDWGDLPNSKEDRCNFIISKLKSADLLIPIFEHRYMSTQYTKDNPIFSIYGTDIICYGEDLFQYLMIEFKYQKHSVINYYELKKVEFWSDLL